MARRPAADPGIERIDRVGALLALTPRERLELLDAQRRGILKLRGDVARLMAAGVLQGAPIALLRSAPDRAERG